MRYISILMAILSLCVLPERAASQDVVDQLIKNTDALLTISYAAYGKKSDKEITKVVKSTVADKLKDPDSAQFKDIRVIRRDGKLYACGKVNGKNSYGGYTGFEWFMTGPVAPTFFESDASGQIMIPKYCL